MVPIDGSALAKPSKAEQSRAKPSYWATLKAWQFTNADSRYFFCLLPKISFEIFHFFIF